MFRVITSRVCVIKVFLMLTFQIFSFFLPSYRSALRLCNQTYPHKNGRPSYTILSLHYSL